MNKDEMNKIERQIDYHRKMLKWYCGKDAQSRQFHNAEIKRLTELCLSLTGAENP